MIEVSAYFPSILFCSVSSVVPPHLAPDDSQLALIRIGDLKEG